LRFWPLIAVSVGAFVTSFLTSPGVSAAYQQVAELETYGSGYGRILNPGGVATDSRDNLYVADAGNARILKFSPSGEFVKSWGGSGERLGFPWGVAVDSDDTVYVTEPYRNQILKFDSGGRLIAAWGSSGAGNGQFRGPTSVATDSHGSVYVVEASLCEGQDCPPPNDRVQKFDAEGNFIAKWGTSGSGRGEFDSPHGIAVDSEDNVYVADAGNARIQKFDIDGHFLTEWGVWGWAENGTFAYPWAVATDPGNSVYVADRDCPRVQKFDPNGRFLDKWGRAGSGEGQFLYPTGVATDSQSAVYVSDAVNNRVQKYADLVQTEITNGPGVATIDNTPTFFFLADRPGCMFECSLGSQAFSTCGSPYASPFLAEERYRFRVRAIDPQGAVDPSPAARDFRVVAGVKAYASARGKQPQRGRSIVVEVRLIANERAAFRARGRVRARSAYRLRRRSVALEEGETRKLQLRPKSRRAGRKIARALKRGKKANTKVTVKLTDEAGNKKTTRLSVKLKR
jgi:streptogramin lyase